MTKKNISLARQLAYTERTDITEMLREVPELNELYNLTLQKLFQNDMDESYALDIYNNAYYACTEAMNGGTIDLEHVITNNHATRRQLTANKITQCLIMCLLGLHKDMPGYNKLEHERIRNRCRNYECFGEFVEFVRLNGGSFITPIDFSYTPIEPDKLVYSSQKDEEWYEATSGFNKDVIRNIAFRYQAFRHRKSIVCIMQESYHIYTASHKVAFSSPVAQANFADSNVFDHLLLEFQNIRDENLRKLNSRQEKTPEELFSTFQQSALDQFNAVISECKELREKLAKQEEDFRRELGLHTSAEQLLRAAKASLESQVEDLKNQVKNLQNRPSPTRYIRDKVEIKVPSPEGTVFSAKNMSKYAKGVEDDGDADVIATMMKDVCLRNNYFDKDCLAEIDSIKSDRKKAKEEEEARKQKQVQPPVTNFQIDRVGTLAPSASKVENSYHGVETEKASRASRYSQRHISENSSYDEEYEEPGMRGRMGSYYKLK